MSTDRPPGLNRSSVGRALILLAILVAGSAPRAAAQSALGDQIRDSQDRLDQIRREREQLAREYDELRGQVHTFSEEIANIEQRIGSSRSALDELDLQIEAYAVQVEETTRDMLRTHDELVLRRTELQARLREIYKRGDLHAVQVMMEARSFGELLSRYKYLHLVARYDRTLVGQVQRLDEKLVEQRRQLAQEFARLRSLRGEKQREVGDLESLESQRERRLRNAQRRASQAETRISQLDEEERQLGDLLAELERARREAERVAGTSSTSTLRTSDLGSLNWPVEGAVVYRFGEAKPDVEDVWKGIGIGAPRGTPVTAVEAGEVAWAGSRGVLGQTVIIDHGGGYWSGYLYLQDLRVRMGDRVSGGQVIGHVGGDESSPGGTHVEFQIYEPGRDGNPRQVDPVRWLRGRS
ncbi:MAG: peptidoglycan DD-metalloendopeptidase family protein [Candidatus Palauibacterales bacterium]|nr:peptidoglycan DD-metalloendopeptidase family protein [Candidatus Palauibacterales bacterium]MDP2482819.1 peptidoglycan DD-metalloendopeptidase family protein [Candidatus Palauibacterales bacterium]